MICVTGVVICDLAHVFDCSRYVAVCMFDSYVFGMCV